MDEVELFYAIVGTLIRQHRNTVARKPCRGSAKGTVERSTRLYNYITTIFLPTPAWHSMAAIRTHTMELYKLVPADILGH